MLSEKDKLKSPTKPQKPEEIGTNSPNKNTQKEKEKVVGRKIPQTLIGSYDLVSLKDDKKKRFNYKKAQSKEQIVQNPEISKLKPLFGQCFVSQDLKEDGFVETVFQLTPTLLALSKVCSIKLKTLKKVKLIGHTQHELSACLRPICLKLSWASIPETQEEIYVKLKSVEQAYFLFSSLISRKLLLEDFTLPQINKQEDKNFEHAVNRVQGEIYKISKFIRKWQKKTAKLEKNIEFLKDGKMTQEINNIKEIWTRFTMYNGYFVVKLFEGMEKIELGIPLADYSNIRTQRNWLFLLTQMIK